MTGPAYPRVLQHRDAVRQAAMFAAFAVILTVLPVASFVSGFAGRWWMAALLVPAALTGYSAVRLATLKVVLDAQGLQERQPWGRPTVVTPWDDVVRVRRTEDDGALRLRFLGVAIEHTGGWRHQVLALNISTRDPLADQTVTEWITAIRDAKRHFSGPAA